MTETRAAQALTEFFDEIIYAYSRSQAIADGILVDVTETAREAGFTIPVALTASVWADCVEWTDADDDRKGAIQNQAGRLWDVLWMASNAAKRSRGGNRTDVTLYRIPREGRGAQARRVTLTMVCGPGDNLDPVITIMQPGDD